MHCGHVSCGGLCRRYGSPTSARPNLRNSMSPRSGASTPRGTSTTHHQYSPPAVRTPRVAPTPVARSPNPHTPRRSTGGYNSSPQYDAEHSRYREYEGGYGRTSPVPQSPPYSPGYSSPEHSPQMDVRGGEVRFHRGDDHYVDESTETPGGLISPNDQTLDDLDFSPYAQKQSEIYRAPHSPSPAHYTGERLRLTGACTPSCGTNGRKCPHVSCDTAPCRRFPNKGMTFGESGFLDQADYSRPSPHYSSRDY